MASEVDRELTLSRLRQLSVDKARLLAAKNSYFYQLSQLVGRGLSEAELIKQADQDAMLCVGERQQMIDAAISRNPTIARLNAEIRAAGADVEIRKASRYPEVYVRAERQYGNYSASGLPPENRVFVGLANQPGAGLSLGSDVQALEVHKTALLQSLESTKLDLQRSTTTTGWILVLWVSAWRRPRPRSRAPRRSKSRMSVNTKRGASRGLM